MRHAGLVLFHDLEPHRIPMGPGGDRRLLPAGDPARRTRIGQRLPVRHAPLEESHAPLEEASGSSRTSRRAKASGSSRTSRRAPLEEAAHSWAAVLPFNHIRHGRWQAKHGHADLHSFVPEMSLNQADEPACSGHVLSSSHMSLFLGYALTALSGVASSSHRTLAVTSLR